MRSGEQASSTEQSWRAHRDNGKRHYQTGNYEAALTSYRAALTTTTSMGGPGAQDRQVLLSNIVACRLHIGGAAQARAAIQDAKQCIALNPNWSKGHVRLAAALLALDEANSSNGRRVNEHSNEACNSLQTALRCDPGNAVARQMLLRELRRDHRDDDTNRRSSSNQDANELRPPPPHNPHYQGPDISSRQQASRALYDELDDVDTDTLTWRDRCQYSITRALAWYHQQSETVQTLLKIMAVLIVLYVAFGGRFGLDTLLFGSRPAANYQSGNAYQEYYQSQTQGTTGSSSSYSSSSYNTNHHHGTYHNPNDSYSSYGSAPRSRNSRSGSWGGFSLMNGSMENLAVMGALLYGCMQFGINPMRAMWMMNRMQHRGRGGGGMMYGGGGMFGGGGLYGAPRRHRARWR